MHRITGLLPAIIALIITAAAPEVMAVPQNRYIDEQRLDTDTLRDVNTIALLEVTDPEAYYYVGGKMDGAAEMLGVIGLIAEIAELGKNADEYPGVDFAQSLQSYIKQFLSENNYRIVDHAIERRDRFDLLDEYSRLEVAGADAYLDVALLEIGYLYEAELVGAEIKPVATAIARLVSAETLQVIYAKTFQYGDRPLIHSESEYILSPESHVYESKDDLDLDKPRAIERLDRALEVIAFNVARSVTKEKFVSHLSPTMEDVGSTKEDQSAAEFLGLAATEVAMKTYDEKLWQQSGELAGGDAQKQAEYYIKLRSGRLAEEERRGRLIQFAKLPGGMFDISGTYVANYTGSYLKKSPDFRNGSLQVNLVQVGEKITGTIGSKGKVWGDIIDGETIRFEIYATGGYSRKGTWKIDPVNNKLIGKMMSDEAEVWILTKIE